MPPARKSKDDDNLMMIVGQLVESAKAAADGLKSLSQEAKETTAAAISAQNAMVTIGKAVAELEYLVSDGRNADNLVMRVHSALALASIIRGELDVLNKQVGDLIAAQESQKNSNAVATGRQSVFWGIVQFAGWLLALLAAAWATLTQSNSGK